MIDRLPLRAVIGFAGASALSLAAHRARALSPTGAIAATAVGGKVKIAVENDSTLPHNLHLLDSNNVDVGLALSAQDRGDVKSDNYPLAPGTYQVICTIAGHGNMKATLTVT